MRETLILIMLLLAAPIALAQGEEPTVNDSDFNTTPPEGDEAYLDEAEAEAAGEPTLNDSDFDTSLPADDQSYLESTQGDGTTGGPTPAGGATPPPAAGGSDTPGVAPLVVVALVALAAMGWRRRA